MTSSTKTIDPQQIFDTAEGFREACRIFNAAAQQGYRVITLVMAVNASFALEAYLKCLLFLEQGTFPKTHDLKKLFYTLPTQTQAELTKAHDPHVANNILLQDAKKKGTKIDLDSLLESGKDSFVYFRYAFEGKAQGISFALNGLSTCIRERILVLHPHWKKPDFSQQVPA
jgi:hypothetical protein